jgi:two-component system, OmpR family, sensor kinase
MITHSIRWRLLLWLAFLLVSILSGFGITAYQLHRTNQLRQIDEDLEHRLDMLAADVRGPPPPGALSGRPRPGPPPPDRRAGPEDTPDSSPHQQGPPPPDLRADSMPPRQRAPDGRTPHDRWIEMLDAREVLVSARTAALFDPTNPGGFYHAVWSRNRLLRLRSTNAPAGLVHPGPPPANPTSRTRTQNSNREAYLFTEIGECILVGRSIAADLGAMRRFAAWLVAAGTGVLALGLGGGWFLASTALRPIQDISSAASRISAGHLCERIGIADTDSELGRLAAVLNSTFARLEAAFAQQTRFTADASHELRTPLAILISEAQTALSRERSVSEYRETIEVCLETARQMTRLTQSLLELARYDAGEETIQRTSFDLAECARSRVELVRPLARLHGVQIDTALDPASVLGDPDRVGQVITNLLVNAFHHDPNRGDVRVTVHAEANSAILTITDHGPGIAPDDLPHVFDRFFRGDKSRARAGGHSGLGLAISKAIVDAHGGSIDVWSQPDAGTRFTVVLPRDG